MTKYVALLRGINVGGNKRIKMADLRKALTTAGIEDPRTLLQSGNVIVESNSDASALTDIIETTIETAFGFQSHIIIRTAEEFALAVSSNPFAEEAKDDPRMVHVTFFKTAPEAKNFDDLRAQHGGPEEMSLEGSELYIHYPEGSGRSRLSGTLIEKHLGVPGTARNWNTVIKIHEALSVD